MYLQVARVRTIEIGCAHPFHQSEGERERERDRERERERERESEREG